jgi:exopolysaccharide biosynthesis polyprenyl glycosylphosphotransferase
MKNSRIRNLSTILLIITDTLMITLAFLTAYGIRWESTQLDPNIKLASFGEYLGLLLVQVAAISVVMFWARLYHQARAVSRVDEFYGVFGAVSIGMMMSVAISTLLFKNLEFDFPRTLIIYSWLLTIVLVMIGRLIYHAVQWRVQARGMGRDKVIIVGTGDTGKLVMEKIKGSPHLGYEMIGFVHKNGESEPDAVLGAPVLGTADDLPRLVEERQIDEVIIALPEASDEEMLELISKCSKASLSIKIFPDVFQIIATQVTIDDLGGLPLLSVRDVRQHGWRLTVKRLMDVTLSAIGLVVISPLLFITAILIKLESPGPAFYVQERMGLDARPFKIIKLRSMRQDAEADGPGWTVENDPRRTKLGTFIRKTNVDELPQLINILIGDMSLVGPRPERPVYVEQFRRTIPRYMERHKEKAGLTGWAQVNGLRGDTSISDRTKYDLWYIENWSLLLDVKILIRTALRMFTDKNAY